MTNPVCSKCGSGDIDACTTPCRYAMVQVGSLVMCECGHRGLAISAGDFLDRLEDER